MAEVAKAIAAAKREVAKPGPAKASRQSPVSTDTGVNMDQDKCGPSKSDSGISSAGVVNNTQPLTEQEAEQILAPEDYFAEEEQLRQQREKQQAEVDKAAAAEAEAVLSKQRFQQLDHLLTRAGMYTNFLMEQMQEYRKDPSKALSGSVVQSAACSGAAEATGDGEDEPATATDGKKGKRKKIAKGPNKRQKPSMDEIRARGEAAAAAAAVAGPGASGTLAERQKALLPLIEGELRQYQLAGVTWLISLYQNGLNGILADQMGLGKTVQTVSFLSHLRSKGVAGPFLIVAPLSTLRNWASEVRRWCPSLPVLEYHGRGAKARQALRAKHMPLGPVQPDFPVVVSTYEIVMADIKALGRYHWKYLVVDEGHRLKNFNCRLIRDLKTLTVDNKLLLTGTPLQNNLGELWSLLNFLLPDIFNDLADFQGWFDFSSAVGSDSADAEIMAAEQRNSVVTKLHSLLKPFMLRRLKADVEIALPRKQEILLYAPMSEEQQKINTDLLENTLGEKMAKLAESEGISSSGIAKLNNMLMQMRKNCNHPDLVTSQFTAELEYPPPEVLVAQAGKMGLLDRLLKKLRPCGHKVLIFSQMTRMLDLLESYLSQNGHHPCRIDGSMPFEDRQQAIENFNSDPDTWLFLLSTRAGGLGINLTAADTVIIYDSDWNPHQDLQAMDRCHRIGQNKPVLVFRLATSNSVEGKMLRRACDKMALERLVIKKGVFKEVLDAARDSSSAEAKSKSLSAQELLSLLRSDISMDDVPQSGAVSDAMLDQLLDRSWMIEADEQANGAAGAPDEAAGNVQRQQQQANNARQRGRKALPEAEVADGVAGSSAAAGTAGASAGTGRSVQGGLPYPPQGVGYEVVQAMEDSGLLETVS